jgi:hypothetical protein
MKHRKQILAIAILLPFAAAAGRAASVTVPAGTEVTVRIIDSIDSETNYAGETFRATLDAPLRVDGTVVVPQGAEAIGRLVSVEQAGRFQGRPMVSIELTALNFDGRSVAVRTSAYQEAGASRTQQTSKWAGGGGLLGTVIGAIAGGIKGTFIGLYAGTAGGAIVNTIRGTEHVNIPAESLVLFTLQSPISMEKDF